MRTLFAVVVIAILGVAAAAQSTGVPLKPGRYAITSTTDSGGHTGVPGTSGEHCIPAPEMADPENAFDPAAYATNRKNTECHVVNFSKNGNTITYDVQCPRALTQVELTLSGDTFKGTRTIRPRAGAAIRMVVHIQGHRAGDCR